MTDDAWDYVRSLAWIAAVKRGDGPMWEILLFVSQLYAARPVVSYQYCLADLEKLRKKSPSAHHRRTSSKYIFATKACIDNRINNLLSCNISSTCPHNMVNFGPLTSEICWRVWGTPANFSGFCVLASLITAPTSLNGSQPNFVRCLTISWAGTLYIHFGGCCPLTKFC